MAPEAKCPKCGEYRLAWGFIGNSCQYCVKKELDTLRAQLSACRKELAELREAFDINAQLLPDYQEPFTRNLARAITAEALAEKYRTALETISCGWHNEHTRNITTAPVNVLREIAAKALHPEGTDAAKAEAVER